MAETDIPKRVVVVLLVLVIVVSFLGTITVLQMYATSHRAYDIDSTKASISLGLLPPWEEEPPIRQSEDSSVISIQINKYEG